MSKTYDIIIIGGGVVGAAIARELSRYDVSVALLEKEIECAFGVSKSNSGIIHPGTQNPPDSLKGKLCVEGNRLMRQLAREIGVDFKEVGELIVAFTPEDILRLKELKAEAEELGVPSLEIVDRAWLQKKEPNLSQNVIAALYAPTAGIISPYRLVYDLCENAERNGVDIITSAGVTGIRLNSDFDIRDSSSVRQDFAGETDKKQPQNDREKVILREAHFATKDLLLSGDSARSRFVLETPKGQFGATYIINAAGLFADDVARKLGITDITITPRKGEEFLLDKKRQYLTNHLLFPLPTKTSKGTLVIKTSDGNPMVGPTAVDVESKTDLSTSDEGLTHVFASVKRMIPDIVQSDIIAYFAGLRPVAGKDFIIRHETNVPGCITVAGIQSPGLTAAPAIAVMVGDLLREAGCALVEKETFFPHRTKTTHLFSIPMEETRKLVALDEEYGDIVCRCEMVSVKEIKDAIRRGARTLDGVKFRTRAGAGRCHGGFCTTRILRILSEELGVPVTEITKRGPGSEVVVGGMIV